MSIKREAKGVRLDIFIFQYAVIILKRIYKELAFEQMKNQLDAPWRASAGKIKKYQRTIVRIRLNHRVCTTADD